MIEIDPKIYSAIFEEKQFVTFSNESEILKNLGFLVDDIDDEGDELRKIRQTVIDNNNDKIANVIIAPTLECNAHCFYCFENGYRKGSMSKEVADSVTEFLLKQWNGKHLGITWFGGEPLLAQDIITYICKKLDENGVDFSSKIVTNGLLLDENAIIHSQSDWRVNKIQVSVDGIEDEYNRIKKYSGNVKDPFSQVIANISNAIQQGVKIKVRINFDPEEQTRALNTLKYFTERFPDQENLRVYFAPIDEEDCVVKNIVNSFENYTEHPYISLIKYGRKNGLYRGFPDMEDDSESTEYDEHGLLKKLKIYPGVTNCYATCPSVFSIDSKGDIYKCHRLLGRKEFSSGNVMSGIQKNKIYNYFCNTDETYEECKDCALMPICQGGCKVNAMLYQGHEACAPSKAIIKDLILLYKEDLDLT